jgi:hypothetical protein
MMSTRIFKDLGVIGCLCALVFLLQDTAVAQCSMCKAVLSNSNNGHFIRNFNIAVLVLLLPPVTIFCSIFVVLKKHRVTENDRELD